MEQHSKKSFITDVIYIALVAALVYISGKFLLGYLLPFVIAAVIAWAVQKPAAFVCAKTKLKKGLCAAFMAIGFFAVTGGLIALIFYLIANGTKAAFDSLPRLFSGAEDVALRLKTAATDFLKDFSPRLAEQVDKMAGELMQNMREKLSSAISGFAAFIAGSLPSFLFSSIVTLVASCYIAKDFERLARFIKELLGRNIYGNIQKIKVILSGSVIKLLKGYLLLMLITFAELTVGLFVIGIEHCLLWALLISLVDLLPVFGTGTVLIPWGIAEIVSGNGIRAAGIIIIYITVTVIRNFLEPKVIGSQIGINPLFTLIAMFAGLKLFGFFGLFLLPTVLIVVIKFYKNEMELEGRENSY